jgi:hypothetical protein
VIDRDLSGLTGKNGQIPDVFQMKLELKGLLLDVEWETED